MKKLKKVFAVLLSVAMILGMSTTAFAAGETKYPSASDGAKVEVGGLQSGDVVNFYKIVEPEYNDNHAFKNYRVVAGYTIKDVTSPTADEITTIASQINQDTDTAIEPVTATSDKVTPELTIGTYLVLVTAKDTNTVYNPMIVSVYYTVDGIRTDSVSAGETFDIDEDNAYAKSATVGLEKTIVGSNGVTTDGAVSDKGDDTAIGDDIDFRIVAQVPSYSAEYLKNNRVLTYKITDELVKGLDSYKNLTVKLGSVAEDGTVTASDVDSSNYTINPTPLGDTKKFEITFDPEYIQSLSTIASTARNIIVEYTAKLSDDAGINFDANENKATLEYTHKPGTENNTDKKEDKTYHYTFGIDASLNGTNSYQTGELFKVAEKDGEIQYGEKWEDPIKSSTALAGAKFALYKADKDFKIIKGDDGNAILAADIATSDDNGKLNFEGLDAGKYVLQETEAPEGYSLNETEIPVEITAKYNENGTLASYTITVDGKATSTYTAEYEGTTVKDISKDITPTQIKNTKLGALPSTGGIGTIIFTVAGCLIMVVAAGLYFANRRRNASSESK